MSLIVLGCKLDDIDAESATARILDLAKSKAAAQVVTLGTEMVVYAQHDAAFRRIVNAAALSLCDAIGLLFAAKARGSHLRDRVTGIDLIARLCSAAEPEALGVYLLGGAPGVADDAARVLQRTFPALRIRGTHHGYFQADDSKAIAAAINASNADLLFVGLGFPRQEFWIAEYLTATGCGIAMGVGGSLDVLSGKVQRAPEHWRRFGLEWLYRLYREPHRWRRQLALPYFVWLICIDMLRRRLGAGTANA
ncbi:MAG: WecB/TagA/CpsF family glycosyltransferase [Candidatus Baltobacteraceae bacterium]